MAKKKKPSARRSRATDRRLRDGLTRVDALMTRRRRVEARELLDELNRTHPQHQEVLAKLVEVAVALDDAHLYQYGCEMLYRLNPRDRDLPYLLTLAYVKNGWLGLALLMGRRALAQDPANDKAEEARKLLGDLEPLVVQEIARLGLGADGLECLVLHDQVRSLSAQGRYGRAREAAEQLVRRQPAFAPAYNNGAEAAFHDGRLAQAIELTQQLLSIQPDNLCALANLVRFRCVLGQTEEARRYAEQLKAIEPMTTDLAVKQAEALAWLGDDAGVLAVFDAAGRLTEADSPGDEAMLHHLAAVAEYRQGREAEARRHWRSALKAVPGFELARGNVEDLDRPVGERNAPWSFSFNYFVPRKLIDGLLARVSGKSKDRAVERETQRYLEAHPELEGLVPLLLDRSDGPGRELALRLAGLCRTPAMLGAVRDFAVGQRGPDQLRLQAAGVASEAGLFPDGPPELWLGGEQGQGKLLQCEIYTEPVQRTHAPGVHALIVEGVTAMNEGDVEHAEQVLRRALAIDPDDPVVMNNLAATVAQLGRTDESEALSQRLHERHPDYLFGRTTLAGLAATRGEFDRARQLLEPLLTLPRLHVIEFTALCIAQLNLHLAEGNRAQAEHWLEMWRQVYPEHPLFDTFAARVRGRG